MYWSYFLCTNQSLDAVVLFEVQCLVRLNNNEPAGFTMVVDALSSAGHVKGYFIVKLLLMRSDYVFAPNVFCTILYNYCKNKEYFISLFSNHTPTPLYSFILNLQIFLLFWCFMVFYFKHVVSCFSRNIFSLLSWRLLCLCYCILLFPLRSPMQDFVGIY